MKSGARLLADALRAHGTDTVFCVPGASYLAVSDLDEVAHRQRAEGPFHQWAANVK